MAQAGFGIAIVPLSLTEHLDHSVVVKKIQDMPFVSQVAIVSDAGHHHPYSIAALRVWGVKSIRCNLKSIMSLIVGVFRFLSNSIKHKVALFAPAVFIMTLRICISLSIPLNFLRLL